MWVGGDIWLGADRLGELLVFEYSVGCSYRSCSLNTSSRSESTLLLGDATDEVSSGILGSCPIFNGGKLGPSDDDESEDVLITGDVTADDGGTTGAAAEVPGGVMGDVPAGNWPLPLVLLFAAGDGMVADAGVLMTAACCCCCCCCCCGPDGTLPRGDRWSCDCDLSLLEWGS